jgi:hypothetical protein
LARRYRFSEPIDGPRAQALPRTLDDPGTGGIKSASHKPDSRIQPHLFRHPRPMADFYKMAEIASLDFMLNGGEQLRFLHRVSSEMEETGSYNSQPSAPCLEEFLPTALPLLEITKLN